jgi:hypothetical protein
MMFKPVAALLANPVKVLLDTSPFLLILFILVAALGIFVQVWSTRTIVIDEYNRVSESV